MDSKIISGIEIFYRDSGTDGDLIFFVPPYSASLIAYQPLVEELKDDYRVITFNLPGIGGFSKFNKFQPSMDNYAQIIREFINQFNPTKYSVLGYSLGGFFVQYAINNNFIQPDKIMLISTFKSGDGLLDSGFKKYLLKFFIKIRKFGLNKRMVINIGLLFQFIQSIKYFNNKYIWKFKKDLIRGIKEIDIDISINLFENIFKMNLQPIEFDKERVLIIYAEKDFRGMKNDLQYLAKNLGIKPYIIPKVEHTHLFFKPEESLNVIRDFLSTQTNT